MAPMEQGPIHKIKNIIPRNFVLFLRSIFLMQILCDNRKKLFAK